MFNSSSKCEIVSYRKEGVTLTLSNFDTFTCTTINIIIISEKIGINNIINSTFTSILHVFKSTSTRMNMLQIYCQAIFCMVSYLDVCINIVKTKVCMEKMLGK